MPSGLQNCSLLYVSGMASYINGMLIYICNPLCHLSLPATLRFNTPLDEFHFYQQWLISHYLILPFKPDVCLLVIESFLPLLTIASL